MKRILLLFSVAFCSITYGKAQSNQILNPSFESHYDTSELGIGSFREGYVNDWSDPNISTSDYFVPNSYNGLSTPPSHHFGYEYPRTGYCYGGFVFLDIAGSNFYEYVQGRFRNPLIAGKMYGIECFVSMGEPYPSCLSDLGFYFSDAQVSTPPGRLPYTPQFENPTTEMINTRQGWQKITGSYIAHGGEQYLCIGNFKPYNLCNIITCGDPAPDQAAYLFIDDVAVYDTAQVDTIHLCMNDSVGIGGVWRHNSGLYTDIIGGLPVKFYIEMRPYTTNLTVIEKPFAENDSVRVSIIQTGGVDSTNNSHNYIYVKRDTTIDIPMYNIYGCDSTVRYICGTNIGIANSLNNKLQWSVYPNPTNNFIQIQLNVNDASHYVVSIVDVTGREVMNQSLVNNEIDISALKSGMYFVSLLNASIAKVLGCEKFVKE